MQFNNSTNMRVPQNYRKGSMGSSQFVFPNHTYPTQPQNSIKKSLIFPQKNNSNTNYHPLSFMQTKPTQNIFRSMIFTPSSAQTNSNFQNPFINCKQAKESFQFQVNKKNEPSSFFKNDLKSPKQQSASKRFFYKKFQSPEPIKFKQSYRSGGNFPKNSTQIKKSIESDKPAFIPINPKLLIQPQIQSSNFKIFDRQNSIKQKQKDLKQDQKSTNGVSQKSVKVPQFLKKGSPIHNNKKGIDPKKIKMSQAFFLQKASNGGCTQLQSPNQRKTVVFQPKSAGFKNYVQTQNSFSKKKPYQFNSSTFAKISNTPQSNPVKWQIGNFQFGRLSSPSSLFNRRRVESTNVQKQFGLQDFELVDKIGKGAFGDVYIARQKLTGFLCVLKKVSKKKIRELKLEDSILRQIKIQAYLTHKHLTSLYGFFADQEYLYLILQILPDGSMSQVKKKKRIPEVLVAKYVRQVCDGLRYMHKQQIIHRDLKPENIFLYEDYLKIGDFGCAIYTQTLRKTIVGCLAYISPEQLNNDFYDDKIDVWSVGILTYQLLTGKAPFQENMAKISRQQLDPSQLKVQFPEDVQISMNCKEFILNLLTLNPKDRMTIDESLKHPFMTKSLQQERKQQQQIFGVYQAL